MQTKEIYIFFLHFFQYVLKHHMDKIELDHVSQVIDYHPKYLQQFLKTQNFIMRGDGPLSFEYRHYLAIMVSSKV